MPSTFDVFFLGVTADLDPTESSANSENASSIVGNTYGTIGDPLYGNIQTLALVSDGGAAGSYDTNNNSSNDQFSIDGGAAQTFDAIVVYNSTVTYTDGTTGTLSAIVFQDTAGNLYLGPEFSANADQDVLELKAIRSLTLDSIVTSDTNMTIDRVAGTYVTPDGQVDGTSSSDTIDTSYIDAQGDEVDGADGSDDLIYAGAGDDTILFGAGNDTVYGGDGDDYLDDYDGSADSSADYVDGGAGADTIYNGSGNDTILGGTGNDAIYSEFGDDQIDGGDGADTVNSSIGNDSVFGGAGNDSLLAGSGDDTIDGGDGADTIRAQGGNDTITGGTGDDSVSGGTGNDTFIYNVGDGNDTITDFNTGNTGTLDDGDASNNDFIDLSSFYDNLSELNQDQIDDGILNQSNSVDTRGYAVNYGDNASFGAGSLEFQGASGNRSSFTTENTGVVCYSSGTAIRTPQGDILIDDLKVGDLVTTMDNGPQPIRWISRRQHDFAEFQKDAGLLPVLIRKGAIGAERDMLVSQQHGILVGKHGDHLARAKHLIRNTPGMRIAKGKRSVTYIHLFFDAHQVIFAENIPTESFYPGPMALQKMEPSARRRLQVHLPTLGRITSLSSAANAYGQTARAFLTWRDIRLHPEHVMLSRTGAV